MKKYASKKRHRGKTAYRMPSRILASKEELGEKQAEQQKKKYITKK
ncbi:MAG: hypothetical protein GF349_02225 [Candidatus Magasanikbacteria bacterium]|nr:hypothetical protein [Candidatus Magasanikbacteria bacterium]